MIQFKDYGFTYDNAGKEQGIHDIDLTISQGECVLLCGASGCGKTTLLRSVNGIIPHLMKGCSSGKVMVSGMDIAGTKMYELAKVTSSVFQNPKTQFFNTDVESEIVYSLENRGVDVQEIEKRLNETMEELNLHALSGKSMFALSGGEKQQVAFAGAYIADTPVVVLDEPTANLDPEAIAKIRAIVIRMKERGRTILIAEHRLSWLKGITDRVIYMKDGMIEKDMTGGSFFAMSDEDRKSLGLRELGDPVRSDAQYRRTLRSDIKRILEVKDLSLAYKKRIIQKGLNFTVNTGEIVGITGVNGAGKTTLLRTLAGLSKQYSGSIMIADKKTTPGTRRKRSGMVMQDVNYQLFADSCENECRLGNPDVDQEKATELLHEALLYGISDRHPQSLSGGQKQRLALAVCKASDKDILLLDEPTSGLDYGSMTAIKDVLIRLAFDGKAIILVTHDKEFLYRVCDRTIELQKY